MQPPTDPQLVDWGLKQFGPPATLLAIFIVGLLRKWWVIGWQYSELQALVVRADARADKWQEVALKAMGVGETLVNIAKDKL